jgi:RNA polymerase sigma-70 factor, ECF subfamily
VELTGFCCRMVGSLEAEDAVQETFVRAWRNFDRFEGRATLRAWLYRIAANVCADMLERRARRPRPMDLRAARESVVDGRNTGPEATEPMFEGGALPGGDPADVTEAREAVRLAFLVVLRHLPPKQRAVLILRVALRWKASEVAELLDTSVAAVNSALQRARATLEARELSADARISVDAADADLLARYVEAFASYDMNALTELIHEDAVTAPQLVRKRIERGALLVAKASP